MSLSIKFWANDAEHKELSKFICFQMKSSIKPNKYLNTGYNYIFLDKNRYQKSYQIFLKKELYL